jgi:hypothetical protein
MGLSIHFSGRFRNAELLPAMIEEVIDVSKVYGWKYKVYNTHFPNKSFVSNQSFDNIYGISFTPTDCETVSLTFLSDGTMVSPAHITFFANSDDETKRSYIYSISAKTQFAGGFVHLLLIRLLKYLNDKYFDCFKLDDESFYWETGDENLMRERFKLYDNMLDNVLLSTQTFPIEPNEDIVAYFERLMKHIENLKK